MKTLNDFSSCGNESCCFQRHERELRQSAIDDINNYNIKIADIRESLKLHNMCLYCKQDKYDCRCEDEFDNKIEYIMEKFNITEDDLK